VLRSPAGSSTVSRKRLPPLAGHVIDAGAIEQVALQRGPNLVLRPRALAHELGPAGHPAPQRPRSFVWAPDLGQVAAAKSSASRRASSRSVLALASEIWRSFFALATRPARPEGAGLGDPSRAARRLERDLVV
jgi:hypothetical protein